LIFFYDEGHFHITDFNIATVLEDSHLATSMSGTKPYIAPEIFDCAMDLCVGYAYPVDWWSLGKNMIHKEKCVKNAFQVWWLMKC
jgi:serine/threonine kinase 32